jgi:hypothetical protein
MSAETIVEEGDELLLQKHFLSFGSSFAVEDNASKFTQSNRGTVPYPYLCDANVQTVVVPTTTTNSNQWSPYAQYVDFVAACTQSLVDGTVSNDSSSSSVTLKKSTSHQVPDVITIEYTLEEDLAKENYLVLIQRLRRRYPNAVIVLVQLLQDPSIYLHLVEDNSNLKGSEPNVTSIMNFQQWRDSPSVQATSPLSDVAQDLIELMFEATKDMEPHNTNGRRYWTMVTPPTTKTNRMLADLLQSDSQLLHYVNPLWDHNFAPQVNHKMFKEQMTLFWNHFSLMDTTADTTGSSSSIELSTYGHSNISWGIRTLVETYFRNNTFLSQRLPNGNNEIGDWGSGDDCHIWYLDGDYRDIEFVGGRTVTVPAITKHENQWNSETFLGSLTRLIRNTFVSSSSVPHKHALEFSRIKPSSYFDISSSNNNFIVVNNPFTTPRLLSLSYLTDSDGMSYPKTLIVLNDVPSVQVQPIHEFSITNPTNAKDHEYWQQSLHLAKTSYVGYIPPGKSIVRFVPLQNTELPFRVVGVSILAEELHHSTEYAFEMDVTTMVSVTDSTTQR